MTLTPRPISTKEILDMLHDCDLFLFTAGFEYRALSLLRNAWCSEIPNTLIIRYSSDIEENNTSYEKALRILDERKNEKQHILETTYSTKNAADFEKKLEDKLKALALNAKGEIWLDVSGLPTVGICIALRILRQLYPLKVIRIFYTEAEDYFPTEKEYLAYSKNHKANELDRLPPSLTAEMSETLILDTFAGYTIRKDPTCLILYAGYEKHRSIGVIENINPAKVVIVYGSPGRDDLQWRTAMSRNLHATMISERVRAEEVVSTLDIDANITLLNKYYEMLYDDHSICIAPICSKMQAVAAYLLWERYRDIQLAFPLPVKYLPKRFTLKEGLTYSTIIPVVAKFALFQPIDIS